MKKILCLLLTVLLSMSVTACGEKIEDTNGAEDFSLTTITDENIIKMDVGSSGLSSSTVNDSPITKYSSKSFSGVDELYTTSFIGASDVIIDVTGLNVKEGNFRLVAVLNDEIIHEFDLDENMQTYELQDIKGTLAIRLAGESAAFEFYTEVW